MDIGRAFTFVFDDDDWLKKVAIGGIVTLVPILNFVALGYAIRVLQNIRAGRELPLPEWDDWGDDFMRGLLVTVATLIWALPAIAVMLLGVLFAALLDTEACIWLGYCPGLLWTLVLAIVTPVLYLQYAKREEFAAFFDFGEILAVIRDHLSDYAIAWLMIMVAFVAASVVGSIACGIGIIFTTFWAYLVQSHLLAQVEPGPTTVPPAPETVA